MTASSPNRKSLKNSVTFIEERFELTQEQINFINKNGLIKLTDTLVSKLNKAINGYINMRKRYKEAPLRKDEHKYLKKFISSTENILAALNVDENEARDKAIHRIKQHLKKMAGSSYCIERGDLFRQEASQRGEKVSSRELAALSKLMEDRGDAFAPLVCLENLRLELNFVLIALESSMNDFEAENENLEDTGADVALKSLLAELANIYDHALKRSKRKSGQWEDFVLSINEVIPEEKRFAIPKDFKGLYKAKYRAAKK